MRLLNALLGNASDVDPEAAAEELAEVLIEGETVDLAFKMVRDLYAFTDWRMILVDRQGATGRKAEYLTIPYASITAFSVEGTGTFDLDCELRLWISGRTEPLQKTLRRGANIAGIQRAIATSIAPAGG